MKVCEWNGRGLERIEGEERGLGGILTTAMISNHIEEDGGREARAHWGRTVSQLWDPDGRARKRKRTRFKAEEKMKTRPEKCHQTY